MEGRIGDERRDSFGRKEQEKREYYFSLWSSEKRSCWFWQAPAVQKGVLACCAAKALATLRRHVLSSANVNRQFVPAIWAWQGIFDNDARYSASNLIFCEEQGRAKHY